MVSDIIIVLSIIYIECCYNFILRFILRRHIRNNYLYSFIYYKQMISTKGQFRNEAPKLNTEHTIKLHVVWTIATSQVEVLDVYRSMVEL
jgi:hypothetical protein